DRVDDLVVGKPAPEAGQRGSDSFALVAQLGDTMTLDALRLLSIEEKLPAMGRIAGAGQGRQGQPFVLGGRSLAAKADLKLGRALHAGELDEKPGAAFFQSRLEAVRLRTDHARLAALMHHLAVEPARRQSGAG